MLCLLVSINFTSLGLYWLMLCSFFEDWSGGSLRWDGAGACFLAGWQLVRAGKSRWNFPQASRAFRWWRCSWLLDDTLWADQVFQCKRWHLEFSFCKDVSLSGTVNHFSIFFASFLGSLKKERLTLLLCWVLSWLNCDLSSLLFTCICGVRFDLIRVPGCSDGYLWFFLG